MNIEKWTTAMQEAIQKAFQSVITMNRQVADVEDMLLALLENPQGILYRAFMKANVDIRMMIAYLEDKRKQKPTLSQIDESTKYNDSI